MCLGDFKHYTYRRGSSFQKEQIYKNDFNIFRNNIFIAEISFMLYIACNISTFSVSYIELCFELAFNIHFCFKTFSIQFCLRYTNHGCFRLFYYESDFFSFWWKTISIYTAQKMKFSIKGFFSKCDQTRRKHSVTFCEEMLNGKLHFLCSVICKKCIPFL